MNPSRQILALAVVGTSLFACDNTKTKQATADAADVTSDAASTDVASDTPEGLPSTCKGPCSQQNLSVDIGGSTGTLGRAVYGLTAPHFTESGDWEVYIEAIEGGFDGCPAQDSPTPDWTLILSGLPTSLDEVTLTGADDGLSATFLDYDGRFLGQEPFSRATKISAAPTAANLDTELVATGSVDEDGVIALEVDVRFDGGSVAGHLVAHHCASMDQAEP